MDSIKLNKLGKVVGLLAVGVVVGIGTTIGVTSLVEGGNLGGASVQEPQLTSKQLGNKRSGRNSEVAPPRIARSESANDLSELAGLTSDFARTTALHNLLIEASEHRLEELLEQSREISSTKRRLSTTHTIIQRLAVVNPKRALSLSEGFPSSQSEQLIATVFEEWSQLDLDAAVTRGKSLGAPQKLAALRGILTSRDDMSESLRRQIGRQFDNEQFAIELQNESVVSSFIDNPVEAWDVLVNDDQEDVVQLDIFLRIAHSLVDQSGIRALDRVIESPIDSTVRNAIVGSVLHKIAQRDPHTVFQQAMSLSESARELALPTIVKAWAQVDPMQALDSLSSVKLGSLRRTLEGDVIRSWAKSDAQSLLDSLELLPESLRMTGEQEAMLAIARRTPVDAVHFLENLTDEERMFTLVSAIASRWSELDVYAALKWAMSDQLSNEWLRGEALSIVLRDLARKDPELAFKTALEQPIDKSRLGLEAIVIAQVAKFDINRAIAMLAQVRGGHTKLASYRSVGMELILNGEYDRALKLAEQLSSHSQLSYFGAVMRQWAQDEPQSLFDSLESLPSVQAKLHATMSLLRYNARNNLLSEDQIKYLGSFLGDEAHAFGNRGVALLDMAAVGSTSPRSAEAADIAIAEIQMVIEQTLADIMVQHQMEMDEQEGK